MACGWGGRYALYAEQLPGTAFTAPHAVRAGSGPWYFLDARADLDRKLNESKTKTVEAVGIEQASVHRVSPVLQVFSRTDGVGLSVKERCESGLSDGLGTHVPNLREPDELFEHVRRAWGALRVV